MSMGFQIIKTVNIMYEKILSWKLFTRD